MTKIRSILFNILFYGIWTPFACTAGLPATALPNRKATLWVAQTYQKGAHILMKYVLGLDCEIRGEEYRPKDGTSCLVGAKHYSAYETLHLFLLFDDPAIILKRELLSLPLFGWFLKKLDVIAIDRGNRTEAMESLYTGARKVQGANRPIVIFPQGTRVAIDATTAQKPYKAGIIKLYSELNVPIIPLAMNSGAFWPRNSFWKKGGKVVFEFLPHVPAGLPAPEALKMLEDRIETASAKLVQEALANA
jgi:1-acyl-sn-glycerol-3-phosphate acyltransferase